MVLRRYGGASQQTATCGWPEASARTLATVSMLVRFGSGSLWLMCQIGWAIEERSIRTTWSVPTATSAMADIGASFEIREVQRHESHNTKPKRQGVWDDAVHPCHRAAHDRPLSAYRL